MILYFHLECKVLSIWTSKYYSECIVHVTNGRSWMVLARKRNIFSQFGKQIFRYNR